MIKTILKYFSVLFFNKILINLLKIQLIEKLKVSTNNNDINLWSSKNLFKEEKLVIFSIEGEKVTSYFLFYFY